MPRAGSIAFAALLAACAGSIVGAGLGVVSVGCVNGKPALEGGVYENGPIAFRAGPVPPTWTALRVTAATLAWRDDTADASILLNARCLNKTEDTPLHVLGENLLLGTTERNWTNGETIPFDGREAYHGRVSAKLDGVLRAYDVFVLRKDGCTYDFVLVAPPTTIDAQVPPFEQFVHGFHTLPGSGAITVNGSAP